MRPCQNSRRPLFIFERNAQAAQHNAAILRSYNFDLQTAILDQSPSQISFGSEFRKSFDLEELLRDHPLWQKLKEIIDNGASFPLSTIDDITRRDDIDFFIKRGNHKSTMKYQDAMDKAITEDITRGFVLPLPLDIITSIPNASLAPLGCVKQDTITEQGLVTQKFRMTHDQSFPGLSGLSVNLRVIKSHLPPILYSFALLRSIHYIVNLRLHHPNMKIFICKVDLDAAYRRCSLSSTTATECLTIYDGLLLMALRMTFGGAPCPSLWGVISETMADLGNSLLRNPFWDHTQLNDPITMDLEDPLPLDESVPFHPAAKISVPVPLDINGKIDIYIDDFIGIAPDVANTVSKVSQAIPLAIHSIARPINPSDPIPRKDIISTKKYKAEGRMEETKVVLGWLLNTRTLTISLPSDKHKRWVDELKLLISASKVSQKALESSLGRLNHVAGIYSSMRHFLGRLYNANYRASKNSWTRLSSNEIMDLHLLISSLDTVKDGLPMNNLTFRKPTHFYRSDASEFGLGGYNLISGQAWRFELPVDCRLRTSLNSLEFLACMITIWIDMLSNEITAESCLLSQTDSTTASGWLRKSNFADKEDENVQLTTARQLANITIKTKSCLYSQWFQGDDNIVSDSLSRDFHIPSSHLASLLESYVPEQVPFGLKIIPLPNEIDSWLICLLQNQPQREQWSKAPTRSKFALGVDINAIYSPSVSKMTCTSIASLDHTSTKSSAPLRTPSEKVDMVLERQNMSNRNLSVPPWIAWHRPTSWLTEQIQDWTLMENLPSFYSGNYEDMQT